MARKDRKKEDFIDVEAEDVTQEPIEETTPPAEETQETAAEEPKTEQEKNTTNDDLNKAWKQVEEIGKETWNSIQKRTNVVMVRMDDNSLEKIDTLVDAKVCKSRSEAAAYLISKGIAAQQETFDQITELSKQINDLRGKMHDIAKDI